MAEQRLVSEVFLGAARHSLSEGMRKIEHCVGQLSDEQVWWRPREGMNSIANLLLHGARAGDHSHDARAVGGEVPV
jgi:hypothetical protein